MQTAGKRLAIKSAAIFIGVMVFFTFTSRTINYFMTPKVVARSVDSGFIDYRYTYMNTSVVYENSVEISLPYRLKQPVFISGVYVKPNDAVNVGDTLITLDVSGFEETLRTLEKRHESSKIDLQEFDKLYKERTGMLENQIKDYTERLELLAGAEGDTFIGEIQLDSKLKEILELKKQFERQQKEYESYVVLYESGALTQSDLEKQEQNLADLKDRIDMAAEEYASIRSQLIEEYTANKAKAEEELEYIYNTGIVNGRTYSMIKKELDEIQADMENIKALMKDNTIKSPVSGFVRSVLVKENDQYLGKDVLIVIAPDDAKPLILAKLDKSDDKRFEADTQCTIESRNVKLKGRITGYKTVNGEEHMAVEPEEDSEVDFEKLDNIIITVETTSEYCDVIIPNSAFVDSNKVFVLHTRQSFWGEEYYVVEQTVRTGESNEHETQVTNGLNRHDTVVIGWDRPLRDGARVMLPLE